MLIFFEKVQKKDLMYSDKTSFCRKTHVVFRDINLIPVKLKL